MSAVALSASPDETPDWNRIQILYLQGIAPKEIERQTGVSANRVSARALRYGWSEALRKSRANVSVTIQATGANPSESSISKASEAVRSGLADVLTRSVEKIQAIAFKTPKAALKANQELECVVRNAKTVFGWSDSSQTPSVRISILNSIVERDEKPVIDVTPLPPSEQP